MTTELQTLSQRNLKSDGISDLRIQFWNRKFPILNSEIGNNFWFQNSILKSEIPNSEIGNRKFLKSEIRNSLFWILRTNWTQPCFFVLYAVKATTPWPAQECDFDLQKSTKRTIHHYHRIKHIFWHQMMSKTGWLYVVIPRKSTWHEIIIINITQQCFVSDWRRFQQQKHKLHNNQTWQSSQ